MSADANSHRNSKLKFKEPGARDTVIRLTKIEDSTEKAESNPLLNKIKNALSNSDPEKWEKYGEELNAETKYPKSYEKWEIAYCIDLPNGLLTFRSSQAVNSEYFGGGYTLSTDGVRNFYVELRPRSWNPRTLIDPFFRNSLDKDKQYKTLADGGVAQELFAMIEKTYESFSSEKTKCINERMQDLAKNILEIAADSEISDWEKKEDDSGAVVYGTICDDIKIEVSRSKKLELYFYLLSFSKDGVKSQIKDVNLAKALFAMLEEKSKNAALAALQDVLDDAGF